MSSFLFPVDASLVLQFARAIGDPSPVFSDPQYAAIAARGEVTPPPTFLIAADHFDPSCPRRPALGEVWPGSGRVTEGWTRPEGDGRGGGRGLHAEEVFEYVRHPRVGEVLTVDVRQGTQWEKAGKQGSLHFRDVVSEYRDSDGSLVATARWIAVAVHQSASSSDSGDAKTITARVTPEGAPVLVPDVVPPLPDRRLHVGEAKVGDRWSHIVVDDLTLAQLVRYAGASGDFIALHHDPMIAGIVGGYGGVFAHGMLTMAVSGRVLSSLVGTENLRRFSGRMVAIVHPGDTLTTTALVEGVRHSDDNEATDIIDFRLVTTKGDGTVALTGSATAFID